MSSTIEHARIAVLLPPLSFLKDAPFVTMSFGVMQNNVLLSYPISLYAREDDGKMNWLGFLYAFLFKAKDGKKVTHITYSLCFDQLHTWEIYERIFKEVRNLANSFGASRIEYEGLQNVTGKLFKPCSTVEFGNTIDPDFLKFIKEKGFIQKEVRPCYEIESSGLDPSRMSVHDYTISDLNQRRTRYLELCRQSESFAQLFDVKHIVKQPLCVTERFYFKEEWVVFTESGKEKGCIRWFPQSAFTKEMEREAKIARLLFCNSTPEFMYASVAETLRHIALLGMNRVQIADIPEGTIESRLEAGGGSRLYEAVYMVKYF